jgi:hypothetical protein
MLGISRLAAQLVASRIVLSSIVLVTQKASNICHCTLLEKHQKKNIYIQLLFKIEKFPMKHPIGLQVCNPTALSDMPQVYLLLKKLKNIHGYNTIWPIQSQLTFWRN